MSSFDVKRIGDFDFQVILGKDQIAQFHIKKHQADPETSYFLVEKAAKRFLKDSPKLFRFHYGSKKWKVVKSTPESWFFNLFSYVFPSLVHRTSKNITHYDIETTFTLTGKKHKQLKDALNFKHLTKDFQVENLSHSSLFEEFSLEDYKKGVRGKMAYQKDFLPYLDPFTSLAAWSFQHYEKDFYCRDFKKPKDSLFRLIKNNDEIQLVHYKSPLATKENLMAAKAAFFDQCMEWYGKERVDYISYHYQLDLENTPFLTPEHIYRFNVGTTNREIQRVEEFSKKIQQEGVINSSFLPKFTVLKMQKEYPDLSLILRDYPLLLKPMVQWDQKTFHACLTWLYPSEVDQEKAYTGRKIAQMIHSAYTTADLNEFKPWVDQQELTQISSKLIHASSWESYLELLSHVVAKKHLARKHPQEGYRVGALIPAPPKTKGGEVRWYKVTSFTTNRHIHGYTLEGIFPDSKLPAIKLYRSTASSPAALNSSGSLETDFSHINSPGYTGVRMLDDYDKDFFDKRSIPLWVGYHRLAEQKIEKGSYLNEELYEDLCMANQKLVEDEAYRHRRKSLREVIRENDAILNELFLRYSGFKGTKDNHTASQLMKYGKSYLKNYRTLVNNYIHPTFEVASQIPNEKVKKDAKKFYLLLEKMRHKLLTPSRMRILIDDLMNDLERHIFSKGNVSDQKAVEKFQHNVLEKLLDFEANVRFEINSGSGKNARSLMEEWSQSIKAYAKERNENLESKIDEEIHITGQSLGGACGAEGLSHYLINRGRIPLPKRRVSLYEYDAPGLNDEDNERFKALGNGNAQLLKSLGAHFDVIRRQETGDFLPLYGEVHLGATYSEEENRKVEKWLRFDATINERLPRAKAQDIAESYAPHATRFLEGRRLSTFFGKDGPADYVETHYSPYVQGVLDLSGHIGRGKKEKLVHRKIYQFIYKNRWKLPTAFKYFFREELRNSLDLFGWFIRRLTFRKRKFDTHELPEHFLDPRGCFKVSLKSGIETSRA